MTPKERMLRAYRGEPTDRPPVAPEFWCYYPAKRLGVDMITFTREIPFHLALKATFEYFQCEGWGAAFPTIPNQHVETRTKERWRDEGRLEVRTEFRTPVGILTTTSLLDREEPGWTIERPIKELERDLPAYELLSLPDPELMDPTGLIRAWEEVGESYLLEGWLGVPFFDFYANGREGGLQQAIFDLYEYPTTLERLQQKYKEHLVRKARVLCERTPLESFVIGCAWSCNSLLGPRLWRRWDKPVLAAVVEEVHRHGRLVHLHFHGRSRETLADFVEIGVDCVCPFERPPGGDIEGLPGLQEVAQQLQGRVTMNGNVHTVETLIRGTAEDVRHEVREIWTAFRGTNRVIIGTGDQVGRETPEENLWAMIEEAQACS